MEFYLHRFRLQVEVVEDWRRPRNETEPDVLQRLRNKGAKKRREREVVLGTLFKLLVKDKHFTVEKYP